MTTKRLFSILTIVGVSITGFFVLKNQSQATQRSVVEEQAVIIDFFGQFENLDSLYQLEDQIQERLNETDVGEYDGNEVSNDGQGGTLYFYGLDAKKLYTTIKDILLASPLMKSANVTLRFGPPEDGVAESRFQLESP